MGGTSIVMKPLPAHAAEATYGTVLQKLDIDPNLAPADQLKRIMEAPAQKVLTSIGPDVPLLPVVDGDILPFAANFSTWSAADNSDKIAGTKWCRRVMLGDSQFDVSEHRFHLSQQAC